MNKELIGILVLFTALFAGALYYSPTIQGPFVSLLHSVKSAYYNTTEYIGDTLEEHFNQQSTIIALREENEQFRQSHLMLHQFASELSALFKENSSTLKLQPEVSLARALSYAKFGDSNKVWLEIQDFNTSRVYGLTHKGIAAGIVVSKHGKPLALLNNDPKSSYAVYVGPQNAPGIVHGKNSGMMLVRFIPTWIEIKEGDEVTTSGLDNLFFEGIKVGKVIAVQQTQGFQEALIKPYAITTKPDYFHVIHSVR